MPVPRIDPGRLRNEVAIQSRTVAANSTGEPVQTWSTLATVWARVEPISGTESALFNQQWPSATHVVTMRHYDLTPRHRLLFGSRVLEISGVIDVLEAGIVIKAYCQEDVTV